MFLGPCFTTCTLCNLYHVNFCHRSVPSQHAKSFRSSFHPLYSTLIVCSFVKAYSRSCASIVISPFRTASTSGTEECFSPSKMASISSSDFPLVSTQNTAYHNQNPSTESIWGTHYQTDDSNIPRSIDHVHSPPNILKPNWHDENQDATTHR